MISKDEKVKYDALFEQADLDRDGFVSGHEIKDVFLKSGVAQPVLAHIWGLCDTAEQGKLNNEQFALALWLISRKLKGIDPPNKLTPEMIPPSMRKSSESQASNVSIFYLTLSRFDDEFYTAIESNRNLRFSPVRKLPGYPKKSKILLKKSWPSRLISPSAKRTSKSKLAK